MQSGQFAGHPIRQSFLARAPWFHEGALQYPWEGRHIIITDDRIAVFPATSYAMPVGPPLTDFVELEDIRQVSLSETPHAAPHRPHLDSMLMTAARDVPLLCIESSFPVRRHEGQETADVFRLILAPWWNDEIGPRHLYEAAGRLRSGTSGLMGGRMED